MDKEYNIGDKVLYKGIETEIVAIVNDRAKYVVNYSRGWRGISAGCTILKGKLDPLGTYHYAREFTLINNYHEIY